MKKILGVIFGIILCAAALTSCNKKVLDFEYTFDKAIISVGGKTVIIEVDKWSDYEGEQLQIWTKGGDILLVSSFDCIFIKEDDDAEYIYNAFEAINIDDLKEAAEND